eukprot:1161047-Pelagomonas_calceolata.AAC.49
MADRKYLDLQPSNTFSFFPTLLPHIQGLEDQLLALVVDHERPDLQEQAAQLVRQLNEYNITLQELENSLLLKLANAQGIFRLHLRGAGQTPALLHQQRYAASRQSWRKSRVMDEAEGRARLIPRTLCQGIKGDILEDIELIENLEQTKRTAVDIEEKVKLARQTEVGATGKQKVHAWPTGVHADACTLMY